MSAALERVCVELGLNMAVDDGAVQLVAKTIIALAERGVRSTDNFYKLAVAEYRQS